MTWFLFSVSLAADLQVGPTQPYTHIHDAFGDAVDGDRILVDPGSYVEDSLETEGRTLTLEATGPGVLLDSTDRNKPFDVDGGDLTVIGVTFDGGDELHLVLVQGDGRFELRDSVVTNTRAQNGKEGGSFDVESGTVLIQNSVLDVSTSPVKEGGHIYAVGADVTIIDSILRGGDARNGGGVHLTGGSLTLIDTVFEASSATNEGAHVYASGSSVTIQGGSFTGGSADTGGVYVVDGTLVANGTRFVGNVATDASAIDAVRTTVDLYGVAFVGNVATNEATLRCTDSGACTVDATLFEANEASSAAMLSATDVPAVSVTGTTACRSDGVGSLLELTRSSLAMSGTVFTNTASTGAGLVVGPSADASLVNNSLVSDTAPDGLIFAEGPLTLTNNLIASIDSATAAVVALSSLDGGYNLYADNPGGDVDPAVLATDLVGLDPMIGTVVPDSCDVDALRAQVGSPLIDGGDPTILDADGSPSDIGAFGGDSANEGIDGDDNDGDGVAEPADCNDDDPSIAPGLPEVFCNGVDDDCNPSTVDDADADADGVSVCSGDCDDANPLVSPLATELTCNTLDDDCDPSTPDAIDGDGDGASECADCDDVDSGVFPGATELACNGVDDDCDPSTVDDYDLDGDGTSQCDGDCDDTNPDVYEIRDVYLDKDGDGYGVGDPTPFCLPPNNSSPLDADCDDLDPTSYPGATDIPYDGVDQDCDGVDLDDLDGDGSKFVDDCDDNDPDRAPGADDIPDDGIDQNCTGSDVATTLIGGAGWRCGCQTASPSAASLWGLLLIGLVGRRRRPATTADTDTDTAPP